MSSQGHIHADPWRRAAGLGDPAGRLWSGEAEWEAESVVEMAAERIRRIQQQYRLALPRAIPNDPDYRKHVPIEYRVNAKAVVGALAQDLSKGQSAHVWLEAAEFGLETAEVIAETSALISGLALAGPLFGLAASLLALGSGYQEAAEKIAEEWSASGFSRGAVMGADRRPARRLMETFGRLFFPPNPIFPRGRDVAVANYRAGMAAGYVQGRLLSDNQRAIFWRDLGHRMGDQSYRGPQSQWGPRDWVDWWTDVAAYFRRDHLVPVE